MILIFGGEASFSSSTSGSIVSYAQYQLRVASKAALAGSDRLTKNRTNSSRRVGIRVRSRSLPASFNTATCVDSL